MTYMEVGNSDLSHFFARREHLGSFDCALGLALGKSALDCRIRVKFGGVG